MRSADTERFLYERCIAGGRGMHLIRQVLQAVLH